MSEKLSQAEIDDMLIALMAEAEEADSQAEKAVSTNVKEYDFRTASNFPKEQVRTLSSVFTTFSQILANRITGLLRTACDCKLDKVYEMSFNELNNSLPDPVILAILQSPPMDGSLLLEFSPEAVYMIISRMFGGTTGNRGFNSNKPFTEIEQALIRQVIEEMVQILDEAWSKIIVIRTELDRIELSPQFAQIVALTEPMIVVSMNLFVGNESGHISISIPHSSLEPVSNQLTTRTWYSGLLEKKREHLRTEEIKQKLLNSPTLLTAYFADSTYTMRDILSLRVGDTIRLNHKAEEPLMVKVQNIPKFRASVAVLDSRLVVKLLDIIKEDSDNEFITG